VGRLIVPKLYREAVRKRLESATLRGLLGRHLGVSPMRLTTDRNRMDRKRRWIATKDEWVVVSEFAIVAADAALVGVKDGSRGLGGVRRAFS
jgi:hypothetical protein